MRHTQLLNGITMAKLAERRKESIDLDKVGRRRIRNWAEGILIGLVIAGIFYIISSNI